MAGRENVGTLVMSVLRAMRVTFLNLFRKPVTVHYPDVTRVYPDRYRGLLALGRCFAKGRAVGGDGGVFGGWLWICVRFRRS